VAYTEELHTSGRLESWNPEDDADMDLGEREMDVDDKECGTHYILPNSENPIQ
jgi:hypothetical protein